LRNVITLLIVLFIFQMVLKEQLRQRHNHHEL
jgi:hypothetical protein